MYMMNHFDIKNKIKVVMDCGNAVGGIIAPKIYKDYKKLAFYVKP